MTERDTHVDELLDRYRTGELDAARRERVERHLVACEACRSSLAGLEAFARTVERAYAAETALAREPDWGRLRTAIVGRTSARAAAPRRSWLVRHAPQAALAVLAFVALGVLWQQGIREPSDAERVLRDDEPAAAGPTRPAEGEREAFRPAPGETQRAAEPQREDRDRARVAGREAGGEDAAFRKAPERSLEEPSAVPAEGAAGALEDREGNVRERAADETRDAAQARVDRRAEPSAPEVQAEAEVQAGMAVTDELDRFRDRARAALEEQDPVLADRALAQWRDSLAEGEDLPDDLRVAARALADSLADLLARRP